MIMAMTSAERQRKHRQKLRIQLRTMRLSCCVQFEAWLALKNLARWSGKSRTQYLNDLLLGVQKKQLERIQNDQEAWHRYWQIEPLEIPEEVDKKTPN